MSAKYILVNGKPKIEPDVIKWATWFESGNRIVQQDDVGDVQVSTVFLGLDHSFGRGEPLLWETMIFGGPNDSYQERYSTREEAEAGHARAVKLAKGADTR